MFVSLVKPLCALSWPTLLTLLQGWYQTNQARTLFRAACDLEAARKLTATAALTLDGNRIN